VNKQPFKDEAQALLSLPRSTPLHTVILLDLAKILTGAVTGAIGLWAISGGKYLHTATGAIAGALTGGLLAQRYVREWMIFRGTFVGILLAYPDVTGLEFQKPFMALTKIASCMAIGLVIGMVLEIKIYWQRSRPQLPQETVD
jgi:hypothetical protein